MRRSYLRGPGARGRAIYRPATMSRFESAGDSPWRAWGCRERLGSKPRSQDVVLDRPNPLQQRERGESSIRGRATLVGSGAGGHASRELLRERGGALRLARHRGAVGEEVGHLKGGWN